ncbi:hypothetical protein SAMN05720761_11155 [Fibrobacter sp. UWCM]|uniref:hypothetical protein n=1 Tax=Fibrobacter sp. UWCM TaxID=1896208 RepID=UPI00091B36BA|nr:hypothetical protein [Fibrobacter sp. UWCM]SHH25597.1 hypothetical protein SAMN05720761_11155 [Fibrobacter sp. UWCM]
MKKRAEQTKSIFILEVYEFAPCESHIYQVYKERCYRCAGPCALTWQTKVGYFETLRDAEKNIKKIVRRKRDDVYGFVIKEMPRECVVNVYAPLSIRRYLKDGSLWCTGSDKTAKFKEGDFVEIAYDDYAELGIVQDFDDADCSYTVVACNIDEKGHAEFCTRLCDATCVLPPSFSVQKKYAAALRRGLKQAEKESIDDLPF